jgi:hypothetical protein
MHRGAMTSIPEIQPFSSGGSPRAPAQRTLVDRKTSVRTASRIHVRFESSYGTMSGVAVIVAVPAPTITWEHAPPSSDQRPFGRCCFGNKLPANPRP